MKRTSFRLIAKILAVGCAVFLAGADASVAERLATLEGISFQPLGTDPLQRGAFELRIRQPIDHDRPEGESFLQRAILSHRGFDRPTVLVIEGYTMGKNWLAELARLLDANEVRVEHRYFGLSRPDCLQWRSLNLMQAASDYHAIIGKLKRVYPGSWASAGWSKGGQTAIFHRRTFSKDVAATVAYDAPVNFSQEDPRIDAFFARVGTPAIREKLKAFQRAALRAREEILPLLSRYSFETGWYCPLGLESAFEFAVLEYPFSFWQYTKADIKSIPDSRSTPEQIFESLKNVVNFYDYAARSFDSPASWQFFGELGYYGFVTDHLKDLLKVHPLKFANRLFAPDQENLVYRPEVIRDVDEWVRTRGEGMIYIYGDNDPWAATRIESVGSCDALKMVLPKGNHNTFIESFPEAEQKTMLAALRRWLGTN